MEQEKFTMFSNRLSKVYRHLAKQAKRLHVSCYRIYDHDLPEFPLLIETYDDKLYVAEYKRQHRMSEDEHEAWLEHSLEIISQVTGITTGNIFIKLRQRKAGRLGQYQKIDEQKAEWVVNENNLQFIVNLSDYLDTGLFLDHRITRQMVRNEAKGKKVLNLFCYTASFSVYAAAGNADEVVSVDLSKTYLSWGERNMALNGFVDKAKYRFVQADVVQYLKTAPSNYFDIVILDPPTFSNSKRMEGFLDIQRDHVALINDCLATLRDDGILYFSTNSRKFNLADILVHAHSIKDITKATTAFDFQRELPRICFKIIK